MRFPILALVGPSGAGKSTIIQSVCGCLPAEASGIVSMTDRPLTRPDDAFTYRHVPTEEFRRLIAADRLIQHAEYNGTLYGNVHEDVDRALECGFGLIALVEPGVKNFRDAGYKVIAIRIEPVGHTPRSAEREAIDRERAKGFAPDLTVANRFDTSGEGLSHAVHDIVRGIGYLLALLR